MLELNVHICHAPSWDIARSLVCIETLNALTCSGLY